MPKKELRKKADKAKKKTAADMHQIHAEIRDRAYLLYLDRQQKGRPGDQLSDWLTAEGRLPLKLLPKGILD